MTLHLPTLLLLDIYVLTLLGGLMLHAWWRSANEPTLGYMAGMLLLAALGALVISLRGIGVDGLSMQRGSRATAAVLSLYSALAQPASVKTKGSRNRARRIGNLRGTSHP